MSADFRCPRDGARLERKAIGPAAPRVCPRCGGLWIDRNDLEDFLRLPVDSWKLPSSDVIPADPSLAEDTVHCLCPARPAMRTVIRDGVKVDVCPECGGVWCDGGELQELLRKASVKAERRIGGAWAATEGLDALDGFDTLIDFLGDIFR